MHDDDSDSANSSSELYPSHMSRHYDKGTRVWDDSHTIKRKLSALIPAFDPRPGRMNLQQTVDMDIPPPGLLVTLI